MYVFCAGMFRSCSTWQYEVACRLLQADPTDRLGYLTAREFADLYRNQPECGGWRILKSHDIGPELAEAVSAGNAVALYSYRDLRDVAFSLVHKHNETFDRIVFEHKLLHEALAQFDFWSHQPKTLMQRYEALTANFASGVAEIADHLGVSLAPGEAEEVAREFSLEANRRRTDAIREKLSANGIDLTEALSTGKYDAATLLHWNHIREGKVSGWREQATPHERMALAHICGRWLIEQGYEADDQWSAPVDPRMLEIVATGQQAREANEAWLAEIDRRLAVARHRIDQAEILRPPPRGVVGRLRRRLFKAA